LSCRPYWAGRRLGLQERPRFDHLIGMFSDGKISIDDFLEEKQQEKKLEI
jgi:hypothetical protein